MKNIFWFFRKDVKYTGFEVKFVYMIFPVFIIYLTELNEKWKAGDNYCFIIFIKSEYQKDNLFNLYLILHELTHSKQMLRTCFLHSILYKFNKKYRLKAEVEAYMYNLYYYIHILRKNNEISPRVKALNNVTNALYKYYDLEVSKDYIYDYVKSYYLDNAII